MEIQPFTDSNSGQIINDDATLQATIQNMIVIYPRDIYNNVIEGVSSLVFEASLTDGTNTETGNKFKLKLIF